MSEHDDTLLDEDLGDEEYDLGNDEEEALLADDYELERQNSYKGEEETDDVLDLGVTDALDDLDAEDENVEFSRSKTDQNNENDFYETEDRSEVRSKYYEQDENNAYENEQARQYQEHSAADTCNSLPGNSNIGKGDLREKLQKNVQKLYVGNGQGMEDDDCEEAKERRNRFQNERTIVSPKMNTDIPDSLESVVTSEPSCRASLRGRGRGRGARGIRGGRFNSQTAGHFNQRFGAPRNPNFDSQQPACRSPLLETRPPFLLGVPNNMQNQQIPYQQANPQVQPYRHYSPNGPLQGPNHFLDNRPQFGSNQFQGQVAPRIAGPRMDYGPRGILPGNLQRPPYACQPNQPPNHPPNHPANQPAYVQIQSGPFFANNQAPVLQGPGGLLLPPEPNPSMSGTSTSLLQGNQALPVQGFQRHQPTSQGPPINHPNLQIPNQPPFENRGTFQDSHFEGRPMYNTRSGYSEQPPTRQFNNAALPVSQQPPANIPNVPLPPGHKILINPHFRGAVQPSNDARLAWDSPQQQGPAGSQGPPGQFSQSAPYQNQPPYGHAQEDPQRPFQPNYQQNKSDDPYAYFSDVWQENKSRRAHQSVSPTKQYPPETGYSRESSYGDSVPKYKSDSQWEQNDRYQEEQRIVHPNYRNRDVPSKARGDSLPKNRLLSTNVYRGDVHDQNHTQKSSSSRSMNTSGRGVCRLPQKRVSDPMEKPPRDSSPKRMKPVNRNLQEVRTVDAISGAPAEKKEEDSDPEMQEYRKKMEEQKRLREKILREKENRRKMAAMEKQNEETKNPSNIAAGGNTPQDGKPTSSLVGAVKDGVTTKDQPGIARGRGRPFAVQRTETGEKSTGLRIVRTIQAVEPNESAESGSAKDVKSAGLTITQSTEHVQTKQHLPSQPTRRVVIQKPLGNSQKIATSIQKTVSNLQKGQLAVQNKANSGTSQSTGQKLPQVQQPGIVKKAVGASPKTVGTVQRTVTQKIPGSLQKTVINIQDTNNGNAQKGLATAQNHQRVVLQKAPAPQKKLTEIKTNTVRLENLAASTSDIQIMRMCQGIGRIESIKMGERNATIVFKTPSAAMVFHEKYQRKMVDLSLITVHLVPNPSANGPKSTSSLTKTT